MAARSRALGGFLALAALTGCNEILGIEDRPPKASTSTSVSTTTGGGGHGGDSSTGGGSSEFWARRFGDTTPEESFRVAVDSQGGVLVSAAFGGFLSFDRLLQASGAADGCALKLSRTGDPEWSYHVGGDGMQLVTVVAFDADDVPYAAGNISGSTDFPNLKLSAATNDFFVARINETGEPEPPFTWIGGWLWHMALHESGFSVFGSFDGALSFPGAPMLLATDGQDGFAAQIDSNGFAAWANRIDGGESVMEIRRAARDAAGTVLSAHATTQNGPLAFLAFADNVDGAIITTPWSNLHGFLELTDIVITPSGTVVAVGSFTGPISFDTSNLDSVDQDIFFLAFEINGLSVNVLAFKSFGGTGRDVPRALRVTPNGVVMTGVMSSAIDFGGGEVPYVEGEDVFVVELSEAGDFVKGVAFGGAANQEGRDLALDADGNMIITGIMEETLTIGEEVLYSGGSSDIFVAKIPW